MNLARKIKKLSNSFLHRSRVRKPDCPKAAQALIPGSPGEARDNSVRKGLFTDRTQRPGQRLERGRPVRYCVAEYKTATGDLFTFRLPAPDPEDTIRAFKKCFRVVSQERLARLGQFCEIGLPLSVTMFCEAHDAQRGECQACTLFDTKKRKEYSEHNLCENRQQCSDEYQTDLGM